MKTRIVLLTLASALLLNASLDARVYGDKKKGIKGRYLEITDNSGLSAYREALVIIDPAEIVSDKEQPVDTESVRVTSDDFLAEKLSQTGLFSSVVSAVPLELPEDQPILRMTTHLTLQHGSQAMRFWVGMGAGKSKLHVRIDIVDARTGEKLGAFNGYGTGAGIWSMSGGGVQRMARDDLDESYSDFGELLREAMN
jgi:hypothetical protein